MNSGIALRSFLTLLCLLAGSAMAAQDISEDSDPPLGYENSVREAEKFFEGKSFALAHDKYVAISESYPLTEDQERWVTFRTADAQWRDVASTRRSDTSVLENARETLGDLLREIEREEPPLQQLWADINESLGDSWWLPRQSRNWGSAWVYYQKALEWWAGSRELETARQRYLDIVWRASSPPEPQPYYYYGFFGNWLPLPVLENVLKISNDPLDLARAHYLMAMSLRNRGGSSQIQIRVGVEFEAALQVGKDSEWYDDALFNYAQWAAQNGHYYYDDNGDLRSEPDYEKALLLYRRLQAEFSKGESRYFDQARAAVGSITQPNLSVIVTHAFNPGAEVQFQAQWRNLETIEIAIYPINLAADVSFKDPDHGPWQWTEAVDVSDREAWKTLTLDSKPKRAFYPMSETVRMDTEIPAGAYLVVATGGGEQARDLLLVTDATLVLKSSKQQALGYFCDAVSGAPIADASWLVWERVRKGRTWQWRRHTLDSGGDDGLGVFQFGGDANLRELFIAAVQENKQAFALTTGIHSSYQQEFTWRIYAYTDRPAYRPDETVNWKAIARQYDGLSYHVPVDASLRYEIQDPRGGKVEEGTATLNDFGSLWGKLSLDSEMPLGPYTINFFVDGTGINIGQATLFRLEEYKLPEFKAEIRLGEVDPDTPVAFRMGDTITGVIQADYYFGGPVSNARVELIIYQKPFVHYRRPPHDYNWYYEDDFPPPGGRYGPGQVVKRETLRTDPTGAAEFSFETPQYSNQDYQYTIEARLTDASRREIVSTREVRVTRQSYFVYLEPEHNIYQPGDRVEISIHTLDANDRPVSAKGRLRLTREHWREVWTDHRGREISGSQFRELQKKSDRRFSFGATASDYRLLRRGYEVEEIDVTHLTTDAEGEARYTFEMPREGYYRFYWVSRDSNGQPIKADTAIWTASDSETEIGYRPGNIAIIVDKDTFQVGQNAQIMLTAPVSDRYVLFTVGAEDFVAYQLVHLEGTARLLQLKINEQFVPNCFLEAFMVSERLLYADREEIIVPPTRNFLDIDVTPDSDGFQPREKGIYNLRVTDTDGQPVSAEVSFGLVDEAVYYIQPDFAGDIRQFFYGQKRRYGIRTDSTLSLKPFQRFEDERRKEEFDRRVGYAVSDAIDPAKAMRIGVAEAQEVSMMVQPETLSRSVVVPAGEPAVVVRTDFRSTVLWLPDIRTDDDGLATVEVEFPDSLTTWKATARAVALENRFGDGESSVQTRLPLIARLQAPRFFVVGDTLLVSGIFNNNTSRPMPIRVDLQCGAGLEIEGWLDDAGNLLEGHPDNIIIPPDGEAQVDWRIAVSAPGDVEIELRAVGSKYADAMQKSYQVYEHGIEKFIGKSGKVRADGVTVTIDIPAERRKGSTEVNIQVTPSVAVTMLDSLPYLIDYPYGCTEQTMSRFLPAAIVTKTLRDLGLKPEDIAGKVFGGIEPEFSADIHPSGIKSLHRLDSMTKAGLKRLYDFQHTSGAWGWWKDGDDDLYMSAYVVWGLTLAEKAGIKVEPQALQRGREFLEKALVGQELQFDMQAWMLHALASRFAGARDSRPSQFEAQAYLNLMKNREMVNAYTRALLALSAHYFGFDEDAGLLSENLRNGVIRDRRPDQSILLKTNTGSQPRVIGVAHWGEDGIFRRWSNGGVEATAFSLMALLTIDPSQELIEPVTNWLIKNRRGAQWNNTRDTAITVLALNQYLQVTGELDAVLDYEVAFNGETIARHSVTLGNALEVPSMFTVDPALIRDGANTVEIFRKAGKGPIYFSLSAKFFTLEEPISPEGSEIFVRRDYYRIKAVPTLLHGFVEEKEPLRDGDTLESGDRLETVLTIEGKNNYEYLVLEDLKPAGFEAVQLRSGEPIWVRELRSDEVLISEQARAAAPLLDNRGRYTGRKRWVYQELRDRKVACFIDKLPEGYWEIRYRLRAETPGTFHALPLLAHAMYVPEIRANSSERQVKIEDK